MNSAIGAALIAAVVSLLTLISTWVARLATSRDTEKALSRTLAAQREQLDRTLDEQRTRTLNERFATAADRLGSDKPSAVQLAGVYAMAGLADDWVENRQACVDVLCGYLRMRYSPDPGQDAPVECQVAFDSAREVRLTVIRVITDHLQPDVDDDRSWRGLDFDFTGAVFDGGRFQDAQFTGGKVRFHGARFTGGKVRFSGAVFSGSDVSFHGAEFAGGEVRFHRARFSGGDVNFHGANFSGGKVSFNGARFSGGEVDFSDARFCGSQVCFIDDESPSRQVTITEFSGGLVRFDRAEFSAGEVSFDGVKFSGAQVSFDRAAFSGGKVSFRRAADWSHPPSFDWESPPPGVLLPATSPGEVS